MKLSTACKLHLMGLSKQAVEFAEAFLPGIVVYVDTAFTTFYEGKQLPEAEEYSVTGWSMPRPSDGLENPYPDKPKGHNTRIKLEPIHGGDVVLLTEDELDKYFRATGQSVYQQQTREKKQQEENEWHDMPGSAEGTTGEEDTRTFQPTAPVRGTDQTVKSRTTQ